MASPLGTRLRLARGLSGLSARELDRLAGKSEGQSALIETRIGERTAVGTLDLYAGVLGLDLNWLLRGEGTEPTPETVRAAVERAKAARPASEPPPPAPEDAATRDTLPAPSGERAA